MLVTMYNTQLIFYYNCNILLIRLDENSLAENMSYKGYISKMYNNNYLNKAKKNSY